MMNKMIHVATVALMASGMALAQTSGSQGTMDSQIGSSTAAAPQTQVSPKSETPGAMSAPTSSNDATTPKGETPATSSPNQQQSLSGDKGTQPVMNSGAAPTSDNKPDATAKSGDSNAASIPSYAKPITSSDSATSSSTPSQKSTESGTASPNK